MQLHVEETGPLQRRLEIEVPTAEVDAAFDAVYKQLRGSAHVKGFRKGRVPRSVLERYFGERAQGEVLERIVSQSLVQALEQSELDVITEPRIDPSERPRQGAPYSYKADVEIRPQIELAKYKGLELTRPELPEPEQDPVEAHLQQLRESQAQVREVEEEGARTSRGLIAVVAFTGTVDGEVFEGGSSDEASFELGSGGAIPGFDDELIGMAIGERREFDLQFPDEYGREDLAGKPVHFEATLKAIRRKDLPELDDEFAKDVSDFDTLDELRADLTRRVEEGRKRERERALQEKAVEALVEANPFPVPPSLIERQLESRIQRAAGQLAQHLPGDQLMRLVEGWREEWREPAEREVRLGFLVPEIAKAEGIEVSDEDVDQRLAQIASDQGRPLSQVKRAYREQDMLPALRAGLLEARVVEFLVSEASLSDA